MMSLQQIESESRRAARRSAAEGRGPLVIEPSDLSNLKQAVHGVPFLGNRTPRGFKVLDTYGMLDLVEGYSYPYSYKELFVDLSGFGAPHEPALTSDQFLYAVRTLVERHGAIALSLSECGQFQGHVRVMIPTKKEN
jgi:hypothetical protein